MLVWQEYFHKLLNVDTSCDSANPFITPLELPLDISHADLNDPFTLEEVEAAIKANVNNKAPGHDGIKAGFIKNRLCISFLQNLFNTCLRLGETPAAWGKAIINPIPKTKIPSKNPSEYRGISLQSVITKSYCRMLNNRLRDWVEFNGIMNEEQNGFRPDRNCQYHIFSLTSIIENRLHRKQDTFARFIDFKKAFDSVNR